MSNHVAITRAIICYVEHEFVEHKCLMALATSGVASIFECLICHFGSPFPSLLEKENPRSSSFSACTSISRSERTIIHRNCLDNRDETHKIGHLVGSLSVRCTSCRLIVRPARALRISFADRASLYCSTFPYHNLLFFARGIR